MTFIFRRTLHKMTSSSLSLTMGDKHLETQRFCPITPSLQGFNHSRRPKPVVISPWTCIRSRNLPNGFLEISKVSRLSSYALGMLPLLNPRILRGRLRGRKGLMGRVERIYTMYSTQPVANMQAKLESYRSRKEKIWRKIYLLLDDSWRTCRSIPKFFKIWESYKNIAYITLIICFASYEIFFKRNFILSNRQRRTTKHRMEKEAGIMK